MQFNRVNNKEHQYSCSWSMVWEYMYVQAPGFHVLLIGDMFAAFMEMAFSMSVDFAWEHVFKHSLLPSLHLSTVNSVTVMGACLPFLPIVEAPGCLGHPSSI